MKSRWKEARLGDFVQQTENPVTIQSEQKYKLLGMSLEGRGLFLREEKIGLEIGAKILNRVKPGEFIYSRLFAWKGAFDIVEEYLDGAFVSDEYPTFTVDTSVSNVRFLMYYFRQAKVWKQVEDYCMGVTKGSRNRFKEKFFLDFIIPLPTLAEQNRIVAKLDAIKSKLAKMEQLRAQQNKDVKAFLFKQYTSLVENAEWLPMREVAPITRRPVTIDPDQSYPELGIRSFGKGTFHKPPVNGIDVGTKKLFQIKANDLMFSNVFAWEGAIAVATPDDDGRVGSHRFISCVADPTKVYSDFLCYHLLTPKGMEAINAASPGGAGRNKTLGIEKLERINVPVPPLPKQMEFLALRAKLGHMQQLHTQNEVQLGQLMPSLLSQAFGEGDDQTTLSS